MELSRQTASGSSGLFIIGSTLDAVMEINHQTSKIAMKKKIANPW